MTWSAHLQHTSTALAITFAEPVSRLDLTPDVPEHFASLIAIEARHRMAATVATMLAATPGIALVDGMEKRARMPTDHAGMHPLCCDCDHCLNGDRDGQ